MHSKINNLYFLNWCITIRLNMIEHLKMAKAKKGSDSNEHRNSEIDTRTCRRIYTLF